MKSQITVVALDDEEKGIGFCVRFSLKTAIKQMKRYLRQGYTVRIKRVKVI